MPGRYEITEKVGQLIIAHVQYFFIKRFIVDQNVTFYCDSNATFGLTVVRSSNVTISGLEIIHCSTALMHMTLIRSMFTFSHYDVIQSNSHFHQYFQQWLKNPLSCDSEYAILPCIATIFFIDNSNVTLQQTSILYSRHIGLFTMKNSLMSIIGSLMAYNNINCIIYYVKARHESMQVGETDSSVILDSHFLFGQAMNMSDSLASGLNLFYWAKTHATSEYELLFYTAAHLHLQVQNTSFVNNKGQYGNFFIVYCISIEYIDVDIVIKNLSVVSDGNFPGLVIHDYGTFVGRSSAVYISVVESTLVGSCVVILGDSTESDYHHFKIISMDINKSRCPVAMNITDMRQVNLKNINISNSHDILQTTNGNLRLEGNIYFYGNQGTFSVTRGEVIFEELSNVVFDNNSAMQQYLYDSVLYCDTATISFLGSAMFSNNRGVDGGAIVAYGSSILHFGKGSITKFFGNSADNGGAISLIDNSYINIDNATGIFFQENKAKYYGGGVFVEDKSLWLRKTSQKICFVQLKKNGTGYLHFTNNKAGLAGNAIFGGWIDVCIRQVVNYSTSNVFKLDNDRNNNNLTAISSNPSRVCLCYKFEPSKYEDSMTVSLFPGQSFEISVVAVGQLFGVVPTIVRAEVQNRQFSIIDDLQKWQDVGKQCTQLKYTIHSPNQEETMLLTVNNQYVPYQNQSQFTINILLKNCSLGFIFDSKLNTCACHHLLVQQKIQCNTSSHTIHRSSNLWITAKSHSEILIHHHCPFDYCIPYDLSLNLSTPDSQCANNRLGTLCGKCQPGLSQVFGTSNCKKCSNTWLLLLLIFGLAGVALVVCLMVLNFTVSTGTINGLIFYANIVRANNAIFFPGQSANTFLSWFIAWLNLDLGVETCFYDGLNAYVKIWLQFAFPLYIWLLVIAIIISSRYSTKLAKICGMNSIQILATLLFLSYAKLLRVTITVFQPTHLLNLASNTKEIVWNYDGNVGYLKGRHIPLFLTTLLFFILLLIPYTFILAGVQMLQKFSHHKPFFWVNKLKPLLDAYTGPYKDKHQYWIGFLLFVRICLFLLISINASGNSALPLFGIILVVFSLFAHLAFIGGVYKKWPLNLLEHSFLLNLAALSAGTLYCLTTGLNTHAFTQASVSIALICTVFITLYHSLLINKSLKRKFFSAYKTFIPNVSNRIDTNLNTETDPSSYNNNYSPLSQVTQSVIELREPLLGSEKI